MAKASRHKVNGTVQARRFHMGPHRRKMFAATKRGTQPFLPEKAGAVWGLLGTGRPLEALRLGDTETLPVEGLRVHKPPPLFPKASAAVGERPEGA